MADYAFHEGLYITKLEAAIRKHRDAKGHDRCWENDLELYRVLGEPLPESPVLPPKEEFIANCNAYYDQQVCKGGCGCGQTKGDPC